MNQTNMTFVSVGGNKYAVDLLNPLEALAWGPRVIALLGPSIGKVMGSLDFEALKGVDLTQQGIAEAAGQFKGPLGALFSCLGELKPDQVTALLTETLQHCYTPQNESLADMAVFNRWFQEHPGDMYPLGVTALVHLVKDFFPKSLVTTASAFQQKMGATTATAATA